MATVRTFSLDVVAAVGFAALLLLPTPGAAHGVDAREQVVTAPAPNATVETLTGELRDLVVNDRVANASVRYRSIDGVLVRGEAVDALAPGATVEVTGRRNGTTLFASQAREIAPGAASATLKRASPTEVEGELRLIHVDYFAESRSRFEYEVVDRAGNVTPLAMDVQPATLRPGMRVVVRGVAAAQGGIAPQSIDITALPSSSRTRASTKATAINNVLAILIRFADSGPQPFTQAQVQATLAGGAGSGSVAEYFREVSYSQQLIAATVTPWLASTSAAPANCDFRAIGTLARAAANAAGYSTSSYQNLVYVFPAIAACGWAGLAYVSGNGVWSNGHNSVLVYAHELGHNLGLLHAGSLDCGPVPIGGSCSASEYGDPFNAMGNQRAMHFTAAQKVDLGWIGASGVASYAGGTATYTLSPLTTPGAGPYALQVRVASNRTYWLEYRQPVGFDAALASYPSNGAQVRVAAPLEVYCGGCGANSNDTQLLDMTPATGSFNDAALLAGQSYTDTTYGVTFNVLSATPAALTVQVAGAGGGGGTPGPLANLGFESPSLWGGYQYSPAGASWWFVSAGISANGTAFTAGNPSAPEGGQVAFLQNYGSSASQTATIAAGRYTLSLRAAQRGNWQQGTQYVQVEIDGAIVGGFAPPSAVYGTYRTPAFTLATSGSHTVTLRGAGGGGSDFTAFVDDVRIEPDVASPALANAGFESPNLFGGYQYSPAGTGWSFLGNAGVTGNGSGFTAGNPAAPEGQQVGFLQNYGSSASQTITMSAGNYALALRAAQRGNWQLGVQAVAIEVDGALVGQFQPPSTSFASYQTPAFSIASSGNHTIRLRGVGGGGSDFTAFVDDVRIVVAP